MIGPPGLREREHRSVCAPARSETTQSALPTLQRCCDWTGEFPLGHSHNCARDTHRQEEEMLPGKPRGRWSLNEHRNGADHTAAGARLPSSTTPPPKAAWRALTRITRVPLNKWDYAHSLGPEGFSLRFAGLRKEDFLGVRQRKRLSYGQRSAPWSCNSPPPRGQAPLAAHALPPPPASGREKAWGQRQPAMMNQTWFLD